MKSHKSTKIFTSKWLKTNWNSLLPQECLLCHSHVDSAPELLLCDYCYSSLPHIAIACSICSTPMSINSTSEICGACATSDRQWQSCYASYHYAEPISKFIHAFKYEHELRLTNTLCHELIDSIQLRNEPLPELLIPTPMHSQRLAKRGYNHSTVLAKHLSTELQIPWADVISKKTETSQLVGLDRKQRAKAIKNSFVLNQKVENNLNNKHVAIIDDVMTTGTTASLIASLLVKAGCSKIEVWCIART